MRDFSGAAALCLALLAISIVGASRCAAADSWGGSLDLTSDYLVRGISRTDDQPALQFDLQLEVAIRVAQSISLGEQVVCALRRCGQLGLQRRDALAQQRFAVE